MKRTGASRSSRSWRTSTGSSRAAGSSAEGERSKGPLWTRGSSKRRRQVRGIFTCRSGPSSLRRAEVCRSDRWSRRPGRGEEIGMEQPEKRRRDPDCPKCREELRRHIGLRKAVFEEVDHGGGTWGGGLSRRDDRPPLRQGPEPAFPAGEL